MRKILIILATLAAGVLLTIASSFVSEALVYNNTVIPTLFIIYAKGFPAKYVYIEGQSLKPPYPTPTAVEKATASHYSLLWLGYPDHVLNYTAAGLDLLFWVGVSAVVILAVMRMRHSARSHGS